MRTVVKSHEIAHLWAHQTQEHARCASNMSFHGAEFSSYSTVIASIVTNKKGVKAYLVSERTYSVTTSSHISDVRRAIPRDAFRFMIPGTSRGGYGFSDSARIIQEWSENVTSLLDDAGTSRQPKKNRLILEASAIVERMRAYAAFFGLKKVKFPTLPNNAEELGQMLADKAAKEAAQQKRYEDKRKREHAKAKRESIAQRDAWLNGETINLYHWAQYHETLLRVVGDNVETSRGASFPVSHARRGLALVRSVMARGEEWKANGHTCHLGHYSIHRITADGTVYAGCHVVTFAAIERIVPALDEYAADRRDYLDAVMKGGE
jgi:hypothetical protein